MLTMGDIGGRMYLCQVKLAKTQLAHIVDLKIPAGLILENNHGVASERWMVDGGRENERTYS